MKSDSFFQRANIDYLDEMYQKYVTDPSSVEPDLRYFFQGFDTARTQIDIKNDGSVQRTLLPAGFEAGRVLSSLPSDDQSRVIELIDGYRRLGHKSAHLSPLASPEPQNDLDLFTYGLSENLLENEFFTGNLFGPDRARLKDIISFLQSTYCRSIGVEISYIEDLEELRFLQRRIESCGNRRPMSREEKLEIYRQLYMAEAFEKFLHTRFVGQKRFSLEGLDALVPLLHALVDEAAGQDVEEISLGMAHRGRLNVLTNVLGKPYEAVFREFEGDGRGVEGDGDVKYHLGYSNEIQTQNGRSVYVALNPNPSHLELVNPVILGKVYSRQRVISDTEKKRVVPVLLHGDAAFAGQGLNMELLQLSLLKGYAVGGTVHIILDNQIGFTAMSSETRSTRYPTDLFKTAGCPVFHVNADDPEAVVHVVRMAVEYRQKYKKDVAVDIIGYRRHGHNEGDEPAFTQPKMYQKIRSHPTAATRYALNLEKEGIEIQAIEAARLKVDAALEAAHKLSRTEEPIQLKENPKHGWQDILKKDSEERASGLALHQLEKIVDRLSHVPDDFKANPKMRKFHQQRKEAFQKDQIDWAFAESLAFASCLVEGYRVRLSGQDCQRGTFTQRSLVLHDEDTGQVYIPLNHLDEVQQRICVYNSLLSELAVLGFDYGFALSNPRALVMWEAQFGDFSNGAQAMIDTFISSGESKWGRRNGMVLMLPHGYEGQGPEHSSARLERYLQLCGDENMRVCNCTTPANYFHVLRRQVIQLDRKPLILMTPKSLLRHKHVLSAKSDFTEGQLFQKILVGDLAFKAQAPKQVKRLILCSGKVYYDLMEKMTGKKGIEVIRLEQLYPFPEEEIRKITDTFTSLKEVVWLQEEKKNMGAWSFVEPYLRQIFSSRKIESVYIGRRGGSSPATGFIKVHQREQSEIVDRALSEVLE